MTTTSAVTRIPELDGLRGIAISLVVLRHYFYWGPPSLPYPDPSAPTSALNHLFVAFQRVAAVGWSGVDLFFVLSGFLIGGILIDSKNSENYYKTFYMRRSFRILPIYYLFIIGYCVLMWTSRHFMTACFYDPVEPWPDTSVLWLFGFIQNFNFISRISLGWCWFSPTWSLAVEEQFYLVAPLLVRRLSRRALFVVMCAIVLGAPALRMLVHFHVPADLINLELAYTLMPCRADALAIGILAALLWRTESFRKWLSSHSSIFYGLVGMFLGGFVILGRLFPGNLSLPMESIGYTWIATFYGLVLLLVLQNRSRFLAAVTRFGPLRELGKVSYCFYLLHHAVGWLMRQSLMVTVRNPGPWAFAAAYSAAAIIVYVLACASWRNIESPLLDLGRNYKY